MQNWDDSNLIKGGLRALYRIFESQYTVPFIEYLLLNLDVVSLCDLKKHGFGVSPLYKEKKIAKVLLD